MKMKKNINYQKKKYENDLHEIMEKLISIPWK